MKRLILPLALLLSAPAASAQKKSDPRYAITLHEPELFHHGPDSLIFHTRLDIPAKNVRKRTAYALVYRFTNPDYPEHWQQVTLRFQGDRADRYENRQRRKAGESEAKRGSWQFKHGKRDTLPMVYTGHIPRHYWMRQGDMLLTVHRTYQSRPRKTPEELEPVEFRPVIRKGTPKSPSPESLRHTDAPMSMEKATE